MRPLRSAHVHGFGPGLVVAFALAAGALATACDPAAARGKAKGDDSGPIANLRIESPTIDAELPDFALVDHHDKKFTKADMVGKVWVTDFIFTSCPSVCPGLTKKMSDLAKELSAQDGVRFLSITVDPETDTPALLGAFAKKNGEPRDTWFLVTGDKKLVEETVLKGFMTAVQRGSVRTDISHAERFVIVDKKAHVRGIYETNEEGLASLKARILELSATP